MLLSTTWAEEQRTNKKPSDRLPASISGRLTSNVLATKNYDAISSFSCHAQNLNYDIPFRDQVKQRNTMSHEIGAKLLHHDMTCNIIIAEVRAPYF